MDKKLHILFLNSWYPSRVLPTSGDFIQRHAKAVATIHQVTAVHIISDSKLKQKFEITDKNINKVRTIIAYLKPTTNLLNKILLYFRVFKQVLNSVKPIDLVHLNVTYPAGLFALYLKWFKRKPFIISEHWHYYYKPFCYNISIWQKFISKIITKNASYVCPVTNNLAEAMQNFGLRGNYLKVPNVVDTLLFKPTNKKHKSFNVIHISSMRAVKNVPEILKVIGKLPVNKIDFKFFLIGENASGFKVLSKKLGIKHNNIRFVDQTTQHKLVPYLQQADVFVLFSDIETSSVVILESFACGTPVVSTKVGGISEHFPDNFGIFIPKNDSEALLKTLIACSKQPKRATQEEMHNYITENFSPLIIAKQFTKVYLSALKM